MLKDLFKEFHRDAIRQEFPAGVRVLYDTLLYEFAQTGTEEIGFSIRDLSRLTCLPATSIHRDLKFLCDRHYVKTVKTKRGTIIQLPHGRNTCETQAEHRRNTSGTLAEHRRNTSGTLAEQSAGFDVDANITHAPAQITNKPLAPIEKSLQKNEKNARANLTNGERELNELKEFWATNHGTHLSAQDVQTLQELVERHGLAFVKQSIADAAQKARTPEGDCFISIAYLLNAIRWKLKGAAQNDTRARKSERSVCPSQKCMGAASTTLARKEYKRPVRTGKEPWLAEEFAPRN